MKKNVLAIDFGGSNGRVILGVFDQGKLSLEEIHRFPNQPITKQGSLYWDFPRLCHELVIGIEKATARYEIDSIGIDTWGVDYGLLDDKGLLAYPRHYRDPRTQGQLAKALEKISPEALYAATGNQLMEINTLFQLLTEREVLENATTLLFMPDLFGYFLTGKRQTEMTIASTSQLLNPLTSDWNWEIIELFDLPKGLFPRIVSPGTLLGAIKPELGLPGIPVINVGSHDTASAVASVPSDHRFLFVSCGTWSLVGTELRAPILTKKAQAYNLTNEKGLSQTTRFLKNITGLWLLQEVKREFDSLGRHYSYQELEQLALEAESMACLIDTDAPVFLGSGQMIERIQSYAKESGQPIPITDGQLIRCIYESLAFKYKYTFLEIIDTVGYEFDGVNIVGGGANSQLLCQMVASASQMTVYGGPTEATAIGNINMQLVYHGALGSLKEGRLALKVSEAVKGYLPQKESKWDREFGRYQQLLAVNSGEDRIR